MQAAKKKYPGKKLERIEELDDFERLKDSEFIEILRELRVISRPESRRLKSNLDLRNDCGHPTLFRPLPASVTAFTKEVLEIAFGVRDS